MQINCHAHVFNLLSCYSEGAIKVIENRMKEDLHAPTFLIEATIQLLRQINEKKAHGEKIESPHLDLIRMIQEKRGIKDFSPHDFKDLVSKDNSKRKDFSLEGFIEAFRTKLDVHIMDMWDWMEFLWIGFMPDMDTVTDHLMNQVGNEDIVVAHMMNITDGSDSDVDIFQQQVENTVRQVERYPGRILAFYAFHPERPQAIELFKKEFDLDGNNDQNPFRFVGVKLYPTLGYKIEHGLVKEVLGICDKEDLPVLMHCSPGGFRYGDDTKDFCRPDLWNDILEDNKNLKICFAHFGGEDEFLTKEIKDKDGNIRKSWSEDIKDLMNTYQGRVFADIANHTFAPRSYFTNPFRYRKFKKRIREFLEDDFLGKQVLWGTDFWMNRWHCREDSYYNFFNDKFETHMPKMAVTNPAVFLGLPLGGLPMGKNIDRYLNFFKTLAEDNFLKAPAQWVVDALS